MGLYTTKSDGSYTCVTINGGLVYIKDVDQHLSTINSES